MDKGMDVQFYTDTLESSPLVSTALGGEHTGGDMARSHLCQEKWEIAQINAEDLSHSATFRAEMAEAARVWAELSDQWLELELRQNLFPGGIIKRA